MSMIFNTLPSETQLAIKSGSMKPGNCKVAGGGTLELARDGNYFFKGYRITHFPPEIRERIVVEKMAIKKVTLPHKNAPRSKIKKR